MAALSLRRTLDWTSDETAFVSAVQVCPRSAKLHNQLCTLRSNQRRHAEALAHCEAAYAIDPQVGVRVRVRARVRVRVNLTLILTLTLALP